MTTTDAGARDRALALLERLESRVGALERERAGAKTSAGAGAAPAATPAASAAAAAADPAATGVPKAVADELERLRDRVARQEYRIQILTRSLKAADDKIVALGGKVE